MSLKMVSLPLDTLLCSSVIESGSVLAYYSKEIFKCP